MLNGRVATCSHYGTFRPPPYHSSKPTRQFIGISRALIRRVTISSDGFKKSWRLSMARFVLRKSACFKFVMPLACLALGIGAAWAQPAPAAKPAKAVHSIKAGEVIVDPPTLINLGFEWFVSGDDSHNAKVAVSYRKKGDTEWKEAMPLMRLYKEQVLWGNEAKDDQLIKI